MTGHQDHPGTGKTATGEPTHRLSLEELARAVGVRHVSVVDPYDRKQTGEVISAALQRGEPSVVIARRRCVLLDRESRRPPRRIDVERCVGCGQCLTHGCPAISDSTPAGGRKKRVEIIAQLCVGCNVCGQLCSAGAIVGEPPRA
jgi:indolepyruvate ferredoxin oxidoreductase alpha subunit